MKTKLEIFAALATIIGTLATIYVLFFGDNIYQQKTGRSIYEGNPTYIVEPLLETPSSTVDSTETQTPIIAMTNILTIGRTITPTTRPSPSLTSTFTATPTPIATALLSTSCTWKSGYGFSNDIKYWEYNCACNDTVCSCIVTRHYKNGTIDSDPWGIRTRYTINQYVYDESGGKCIDSK